MSRRVLPFAPAINYTIAATAASSSTAVDAYSMACRVVNSGAVGIFVNFTTGAVAATITNGTYIPAGGIETFTKGAATHINVICSSTTATVYVTVGEGL